MIRLIHCSRTLSHVYLHICVILCILLRLRDIGLPFFPYITGCWLIFGVGSLSYKKFLPSRGGEYSVIHIEQLVVSQRNRAVAEPLGIDGSR